MKFMKECQASLGKGHLRLADKLPNYFRIVTINSYRLFGYVIRLTLLLDGILQLRAMTMLSR